MKRQNNNNLRFVVIIAICCICVGSTAQDKRNLFNPVNTGVTSLSISSDATGMALGDNGVATSPDNQSQYWNPAKYVFSTSRGSIGHSVKPWLRSPVKDMWKTNATGFYQFKGNAISASWNFFSLGKVYLSDSDDANTIHPREYSIELAYSRQIGREHAVALTARYVHSDITYDYTAESTPGKAFSMDLSYYWAHQTSIGHLNVGAALKNIGTKISYGGDENAEFIPTSLSVGTGFCAHIHREHQFGIYLQLDKLLVPTYPKQKYDECDEDYTDRVQTEYYDVSPIKGIFNSFHDAPNGFKEEMKEITCAIGVEYCLFRHYLFRQGIHLEARDKGNRKYCSFGMGVRFNPIEANISYIRTISNNPLDKTICADFAFRLPLRFGRPKVFQQ